MPESDIKYQLLFNAIDEGFCIVEVIFDKEQKPVDYRFLEINPSFAKQTGLIDAQGKRMRELAPEHEEYWFEIYGKIALTGQAERFVNLAGQLHRWFDVYAFRVGNPADRQVAVLFCDITELKKTEDDLKHALEWQKAIFEGSRDSIFITDTDSRFVAVNNAACKMTGYSREQLLQKRIPDLHDIPDLKAYNLYHQRIFSGEEILSEAKILRSDGTKVDAEFNNRLVSIGGNLYMHTTGRDITERKITEKDLSESEATFRHIFENSVMGISQAYAGGKLLRINQAYAEMYGFPDTSTMLKEITNNTIKLYANPSDRQKVLEILDKKGYMEPAEFELKKRNGENFWALVSAKQVRDDTGKFLFLQAEHIDITELKVIENKLKKSQNKFRNLSQHLEGKLEKERSLIAMNLHDDLGQKLTALDLDLAWIRGRIGVQSSSVRKKLTEMSLMINEIVESIKEISSFLRPAILFDLGLFPAIISLLDKFKKTSGIKYNLQSDTEEINIDDRISLIVYRVLQEALTNVARHSEATKVEVTISLSENRFDMEINDNGKGIDNEKVISSNSMGITGIRERVKGVHGKLEINRGKEAGTTILVSIPLNQTEND
jgi:two-component system sensor histidine kinase UhpB